MGVQFIGMVQPREQSEIRPARGEAIDLAWLRESMRAHEAAGFERVLIGWYSNGPDGIQLAAHASAYTERLGFLVAHRPGFQSPTNAARAFATLDQLSGGRAAIHVISGGDDADQARDGDWLGKDDRYARTDEYVSVLKSIWTADAPVDHSGRFYRFRGAPPDVRCVQLPHIPVYFGGASEAAIEAAAWAKAETMLAEIQRVRGQAWLGPNNGAPQSVGSQRLLEAAALGDRPEGRLYTAIARATGARGNTTALVGTPEQVAEAFAEYYELGVGTFLIRGFEPLTDAVEYGRSLLPATRALLGARVAAE